jgi:hypothetical protein
MTKSQEQAGIAQVPGLFLTADDGGWLVNIGLVAWRRGPIELREVRRQLRAEGRKLRRIGGRDFIRCLPDETVDFYRVAAYWAKLFFAEQQRMARRG